MPVHPGFVQDPNYPNGVYEGIWRGYIVDCSSTDFSNADNNYLFMQTIQSGSSYIDAASGTTVRFFVNGAYGLDNAYPYPAQVDGSDHIQPTFPCDVVQTGEFGDGPGLTNVASNFATRIDLAFTCQMYLMLRPGGVSPCDVPLIECDWTAIGSIVQTGGQWGAPTNSSTASGDTQLPAYPLWSTTLTNGVDPHFTLWKLAHRGATPTRASMKKTIHSIARKGVSQR